MKKQGLVNVARNKKDSRQRDVSLTVKGAHKYQDAAKVLKKHQRRFINLLNDSESDGLALMAKKLS
jgi:DNA-binding MarR family transcriptional regulator